MSRSRIGLPAALVVGLAVVAVMPLTTAGQSAASTPAVVSSTSPTAFVPSTAPWGGLSWSAPVAGPDGNLRTIIPFGDSLVAVGDALHETRDSAAAWRSVDGGATWYQTLLDGEPGDDVQMSYVVAISSGLLAIGSAGPQCRVAGEGERCPPLPKAVWTTVAMWTSVDGRAWLRVPTPRVFADADVSGLASGPDGVMAVGDRGFDRPRLWTSPDGTTWETQHLLHALFRKAHFMDIAAIPVGWVIVGSSGGTPPTGMAIRDPNGSKGAAWSSADGLTWTSAPVAGRGPEVELQWVYQGIDGLLAMGTREGGKMATLWTSTDGQRWALVPKAADGSYGRFPIAADGLRIIGRSDGGVDSVSFSVSGDGKTWRTLANLGDTATMPRWPGRSGAPFVDSAFVLPDGVLFLGRDDNGATIVWRTTAVTVADLAGSSPSPSAAPD